MNDEKKHIKSIDEQQFAYTFIVQVLSFKQRFQMSKYFFFLNLRKHFVTSSRIKHDRFFFRLFLFHFFFLKFKSDFS